jgi:hypothetical protein
MFISYQFNEDGFITSKVIGEEIPICDNQITFAAEQVVEMKMHPTRIPDPETGLPIIKNMLGPVEMFDLQGKVIDLNRMRIYDPENGNLEFKHPALRVEKQIYATRKIVAEMRQLQGQPVIMQQQADADERRAEETFDRQERINAGLTPKPVKE